MPHYTNKLKGGGGGGGLTVVSRKRRIYMAEKRVSAMLLLSEAQQIVTLSHDQDIFTALAHFAVMQLVCECECGC